MRWRQAGEEKELCHLRLTEAFSFQSCQFFRATASWGRNILQTERRSCKLTTPFICLLEHLEIVFGGDKFLCQWVATFSPKIAPFFKGVWMNSSIDFLKKYLSMQNSPNERKGIPISLCIHFTSLMLESLTLLFQRKQCNVNPGCSFTQGTLGTCPHHFSFSFFLNSWLCPHRFFINTIC